MFLAAFVGLSCTGGGFSKNADPPGQSRGLIVGFEGLQPFSGDSIHVLTREVAADLHMSHEASSGFFPAHLPSIRAAHARGEPIYIVGYSLGGLEATRLSQALQRENIPVRVLFLLDPGALCSFSEKIPRNVSKVVFYESGTCDATMVSPQQYLQDPAATRAEFEDLPSRDHLNLPAGLAQRIAAKILAGS